jgi:hypothetical protein
MKKISLIILVAWLNNGFAQNTVPNGNFEVWTDQYHAESWDGMNYEGTWINFLTFSRTEDAHSGNYAAQIENVSDELIGLIPGMAFTGTFEFDPLTYEYTIKMGVPVTGRPTSLNGYFKYSPAGGDTMVIAIGMFKWNEQEMDLDSIGGGIYFTGNSVTTYTNFHIPIQYYSNDDADTMYILMTPSTDTYHEGSKLLTDDLTLSYNPSGTNENYTGDVYCFPNPASDFLMIETAGQSQELSYIIRNLAGVTVLSGIRGNKQVDIRNLRDGLYFLSVYKGDSQVLTQKIIIQH